MSAFGSSFLSRIVLTALTVTCASPASSASAAQVPFVGCRSDGQMGPQPAPKDGIKSVAISPLADRVLAYYSGSAELGVLAPRNWHCILLVGSNGEFLLVTPSRIDNPRALSNQGDHLDGPAIQASISLGGTSGRFEVAQVASRIFPIAKAFVGRIASEPSSRRSDYPTKPYPTDKLFRRSATIVEFETPPHARGLGTQTWLKPNGSAIRGAAFLAIDPDDKDLNEVDLALLAVRLPKATAQFSSIIVRQFESER